MKETGLHAALRRISQDLSECGASYALIGGLAVSARTEPRFTRDVDLAIAVSKDSEAEAIVIFLKERHYRIGTLVEQETVKRLATVRMVPPGEPSLVVDLLFASSGIEPEIVAAAKALEIIPGMVIPVATIAHLIVTKVLSRDDNRRPQDRVDLASLLKVADQSEIDDAREALKIVHDRGFHRGKDLLSELQSLLSDG